MLTRLGVLTLAGYGGWKLYETYKDRMQDLDGPMHEFADSTTTATRSAVRDVSSAAEKASGAVKDSAAEVSRAAKDAAAETNRAWNDDRGVGARVP